MKKIISFVRYQLKIYFYSSHFVMPLIATMAFLFFLYQQTQTRVLDSCIISCYFLYILMICIGFTTVSSENVIMEQIQHLYAQKPWRYYLSKVLFFIIVGTIFTVICVVFPLLKIGIFPRAITAMDLLNAFLLELGYAFVGSAIGSLMHPRVLKDRKIAVAGTVLLTFFTFLGTTFTRQWPILKVIWWLFPPVDYVAALYSRTDTYQLTKTLTLFMAMLIYGIAYSMIKSVICNKRKF